MVIEDEKKVYEVKIAGRSVRLRSSHGEDLVMELADFVSKNIEQSKKINPNASFQNVLFLACLHLSEELALTKKEVRTQLSDIKSEALQLLTDIEASPLNQNTLDL